jgi:hypothetical protein
MEIEELEKGHLLSKNRKPKRTNNYHALPTNPSLDFNRRSNSNLDNRNFNGMSRKSVESLPIAVESNRVVIARHREVLIWRLKSYITIFLAVGIVVITAMMLPREPELTILQANTSQFRNYHYDPVKLAFDANVTFELSLFNTNYFSFSLHSCSLNLSNGPLVLGAVEADSIDIDLKPRETLKKWTDVLLSLDSEQLLFGMNETLAIAEVKALEAYLLSALLRSRIDLSVRGSCEITLAGFIRVSVPIVQTTSVDIRQFGDTESDQTTSYL